MRWPPLRFGGVEVGGVPASGLVLALAYLLAVALAARLAKRRELRPRAVVEVQVAAAVAGLAASKLPAAAEAWSEVVARPGAVVELLAEPASPSAALAGATLAVLLLAWASGRFRDTADVLAPGAALVFAAAWAGTTSPARDTGLSLVLVLLAAVASRALARRPRARGEAALVVVEACALGVALARLGRVVQDGPALGDGVAGAVFVASLALHVVVRRAAVERG